MSTIAPEQQTLRYAALSDQTRDRWAKLLRSHRGELTERARRLLQIGLDACESHGPQTLQARWHGGALWICCQQVHLAQMLDCSDKTVRNELASLRDLGCLVTHAHPTKENFLGYRFDLSALEALAESTTPDLDDIIFDWHTQQDHVPQGIELPAAEMDSAATSVPTSVPTSVGISAAVSGGLSGPFSADISAGVSALMNHDHEGLNEYNNNSSITHDHDAREETSAVRFDAIAEIDIRAIAGFQITTADGRTGTASVSSRVRKLREYFADAVQAGQADAGEFGRFAALFRNVGRRTDVKWRAKYLRTLWTNRHEKPLDSVLTPADREYVRRLIADADAVAAASGFS